jgi:hypothetical protein
MAEGLLGGILGGGDEENTAQARPGTEAFAAAVATNIANHDSEVAAQTVRLARNKTCLSKWHVSTIAS